MNTRLKIIIISALLVLAIASVVLAAASTVRAFHAFQQQRTLVKVGDVRAVHDWMTVPYIARVYHVPQSTLYTALHLAPTKSDAHMTLNEIAQRRHVPVTKIIQLVQQTILQYRRQHPQTPTPTPKHTLIRQAAYALSEYSV
jgi:LysM repeat protein